ncbi:MAG: alpha/beta hydrolase [Dehalococcoidia bacterium]|nr:alpha/beta hydrolase [Dehalococcoidia bacterium]
MEPESRYVTSQRVQLHYVVWGEADKPPLILLHGGRDHARSWDRTALALIDRYQVFAVDLRGHGDSDWALGGNYSIIDYALDLHAVVGEIGRTPVTLVAHSLGGSIALQYAGTVPENVQAVVSIEGLGRLQWAGEQHRPAHERMREWLADMRELAGREPRIYPTFEDAVARMREANSHLSPELARHLTVHGVREVEGGYLWKFDNHVRSRSPYEFNMEDARDIWNQIRAPILFIQGAESWGKQDAADYSAFHYYRAETVEDSGHWVHHDQFDRFLELAKEFLAETGG